MRRARPRAHVSCRVGCCDIVDVDLAALEGAEKIPVGRKERELQGDAPQSNRIERIGYVEEEHRRIDRQVGPVARYFNVG